MSGIFKSTVSRNARFSRGRGQKSILENLLTHIASIATIDISTFTKQRYNSLEQAIAPRDNSCVVNERAIMVATDTDIYSTKTSQ